MFKVVLEVKNVTVELGGEIILRDINLTVYEHDTIVFIGPSGSGKTVLLKTLLGLYKPIKGTVKWYGEEWQNLSIDRKHDFSRRVGMQFQKSALFDDLDVFNNVAYPMREHGRYTKKEIQERVLACLRSVNLEKAQHLQTYELSGGMRLRLGVARAIVLKPEILFMDDPTAGLDPVSSDEMADLILKLKKEIGSTLIVVTHDILRSYQFAGRIFLVAKKTVFETGSAEQTRNHKSAEVQQFIHGWIRGPLTESLV